jgi:hypothetical protein
MKCLIELEPKAVLRAVESLRAARQSEVGR